MSINSPDFLARIAAENLRRTTEPAPDDTMSPLERVAADAEAAALERIRAEQQANRNKLLEAETIAKSLAHLALTKQPEPVPTNLRVAKRMYGGLFKLFYQGDDVLAEGWVLDRKMDWGVDKETAYDGVFLDTEGPLRTYRAYDKHPGAGVWYPRDNVVTGWSLRAYDGYEGTDYMHDRVYGEETIGLVHAGQHDAEYIMGLLVTFAADHQLVPELPPTT